MRSTDASLKVVDLLALDVVGLRCNLLPANQSSSAERHIRSTCFEGIVRHKQDRIEARQEFRLSYVAEDFVRPLQRVVLVMLNGAI
jgi:hypothetical protein